MKPEKTSPSSHEYASPTSSDTVRLERLLPGPIERVWDYLTDSEKRATWFAGGPMELRVGGAVELIFNHRNLSSEPIPERYKNVCDGGKDSHSRGKITQLDPPRLLAYTWWEDSDDQTEIIFELTPQGNDVLLAITHRRLPDRNYMRDVAGGWHLHTLILEDRLLGRAARPFWATHAQLTEAYARRITGN